MNKYQLAISKSFKKDYKKIQKRGYDLSLLHEVVNKLLKGEPLPEKIKIMRLRGIGKDIESVTYNPIGC